MVSWLGISILAGSLAGAWLMSRALSRVGLPSAYAWDVIPYAMIGGVAGAKLWAAIETFFSPGEPSFWVVLTSRAGATFYGGLALGAAAVIAKLARDGVPLRAASAAVAPALALGQAIGRVGCFLVGDDYGTPTSLPWGMAFPQGAPPTLEAVHPTQLYETLWLALVTVWLWRRLGRSRLLFGEYLVLQGVGRFAIELVRTNPRTVGALTTSQVIALGCIAAGTLALHFSRPRLADA
jgi:phosphatidylglycerol---prolipoprotein diacylglyceryl transferase